MYALIASKVDISPEKINAPIKGITVMGICRLIRRPSFFQFYDYENWESQEIEVKKHQTFHNYIKTIYISLCILRGKQIIF
ncbi:hypothetical protein MSHOH_3438 [Methanosarcina horonobensis HB-1 = JCM 15518]|uniref:Uncharacterized protein n=1 Tax=Methanosarcina horonobensis HB-1 = JCM 15518 TaxID=1434110 RepID=A0A0E3SFM9_9EURY|nr:hypothetical protein MSHOH_3438 [Methanosarcina horonobensis HB-1 = JCM 15518]